MPKGFFVFAAVAILIAVLLPYAPVKYALFGIFGWMFMTFYSTAPERTLYLFLLGMPVLDLIPPTLIPIPGINPETILLLLLAAAIGPSLKRQSGPQLPNPFALPIFYFCVVIAMSAARTAYSGRYSIGEIFPFAKNQVAFLFLAMISFRILDDEKKLREALHLIAITCTLVSLQALWTVRDVVMRGFMLERNRAAGLVAGQPNLFGGFLAMMILLYIGLFLGKSSTGKEKLGYAIAIVSMSGALMLTLSRGSWIALILGFGVLSLLRGARAIGLVLLIVITAPLWLPDKVIERVQHTTEGHYTDEDQELEDSAQVRVDQWKALPEILHEAPVFGHGLRSFPPIWAHYSRDHEPKAAHSTWVELLSEEGVVGILGYVWLCLLMAWTGFRAWRLRDRPLAHDLGLGFMCAVFCLMLLDTSGTRFRNREVMAYMWVLGGTLARIVAESDRPRPTAATVGTTIAA